MPGCFAGMKKGRAVITAKIVDVWVVLNALFAERDHMVHVSADADAGTNGVIMVAGEQR